MDGRIVAIKVAAGDRVTRGQTLVVLEAMKIQHQLKAALDAEDRIDRGPGRPAGRQPHRAGNDGCRRWGGRCRCTLRSVSHRYGPVDALDGIDLDIADGETVALIGPSGCGKSTLLGILGGLLQPSDGPRHPVGRAAGRIRSIPSPTSSRISPCCRGAASRTTWRWRWSIARSAPPSARTRGIGARPDRPRRIRDRLSQAALRRHAPAGRHRPRARRAAGRAAARRALSALDAQTRELLMEDLLAHLGAREEHAGLRHPQSRGGGAARRPRRRPVAPSRPHPRVIGIDVPVAERGRPEHAGLCRRASQAVGADPRRGRHRRSRDPACLSAAIVVLSRFAAAASRPRRAGCCPGSCSSS